MIHIHVNSKNQAWIEADKLFPTDYMQDSSLSSCAGYPVFTSTHNMYSWENFRILDLNCRIEVILNNETVNIWIDQSPIITALIKCGYHKNQFGEWVQ